MEKVILIDLEDTITIHKSSSRIRNINLAWLNYNGVKEAEAIYKNDKFKYRDERIKLLNITYEEYKKWYSNFSVVEYEYYKEKYLKREITISEETLKFIKDSCLPLILVSNSSPLWVDYILEQYNIRSFFKYVFHREYCFDDIKKPNKEVLSIIENTLGITLDKDSVMIGDSDVDLEFAQNCGFKFISVYNKFERESFCKDFNEVRLMVRDLI